MVVIITYLIGKVEHSAGYSLSDRQYRARTNRSCLSVDPAGGQRTCGVQYACAILSAIKAESVVQIK